MELYIQKYIIDNFMLIAMVLGTYFVVYMKSTVDFSIKIRMVVNMTLALCLSILEFYLQCLTENGGGLLVLNTTGLLYYSLEPLIMVSIINIVEPKNKYVIIPAIINFLVYCFIFYNGSMFYSAGTGKASLGILGHTFMVTEGVYWCVLFLMLNIVFYKKSYGHRLGIFFCLGWLMIATILEMMGTHTGIMLETYALVLIFYYLIIHVSISQQVNEEKEIKLREQRVSLMLSQIQPHFLYNTLNTITALCRSNPKVAEETTIKFSKYLRENMYSMGENDVHPFSEELEHTNIYLDIEKLRFGDRVKVEYDIKDQDFNMPMLTLQPIVENAVKHGICKKVEGGIIKLSTEKKGRDHIITISDNGVGFELDKVLNDGKPHIGIQNVNERLKTMIRAEMEISSLVGLGTTVKITIPGERKNMKNGKYMNQESGERREIFSIGR